jgi:SAM-dependent methyltransferase
MNLQPSLERHDSWLDHLTSDWRSRRSALCGAGDLRWHALTAALEALRDKGRYAVRIVDADCGAGSFLLDVLRSAHRLGFTAIEGRGIDRSPLRVALARTAARRLHDSAIGVTFEAADPLEALESERDFPADIVLWNGYARKPATRELLHALHAAGDIVIGVSPEAAQEARLT